ncbi:MAG TPA: hypothetical protein VM100_03805 [Longimicrobiales bacterium]|nr:hypothetical protein [Longimicrobiales bacterium]
MITLDQIKERKVIRWGVAYLAASWVLLQVTQFMASTYGWPPIVLRVLPVVLGVGLLAVLVLAWYHGEKGAQRVSAIEIAMLTGILIIGGAAMALVRGKSKPAGDVVAATTVSDQSIAVLPLTNMSPDPNDAFFADGIHDEILTHLARIAALDVRSRTSVLEYKNSQKKIPQIATELGVRYVLEGSVRRGGEKARITVQLIDAKTDKHKWAETYDGNLADVFEMQTSVAKKIATTLEAQLSQSEENRIAAKPTSNTDAYDLYLQAREYGRRSYSKDDFANSARFARQAIALDPNFAEAYAALSTALSGAYWFHYDRSKALIKAAREAAEKSVALKPELAAAYAALGYFHYRVYLDYDKALQYAARGKELAPSDANVAQLIASVNRRKGDFNAAIAAWRDIIRLDPRAPLAYMNAGETLRLVRRYDEAVAMYKRGINIAPDEFDVPLSMVQMDLYDTGDMKQARGLLTSIDRSVSGTGEFSYVLFATLVELFDRKPDAALSLLAASRDTAFFNQFEYSPKTLLVARAYVLKGDPQQAAVNFKAAITSIDYALAHAFPDDPRLYMARAHALAGLGDKKGAVAAAQRATRLMPVEKEAWRGSFYLQALARVYAATGDAEKAIDVLERALKIPGDVGVGALRGDPAWDSLRSNPRFQKLLALH